MRNCCTTISFANRETRQKLIEWFVKSCSIKQIVMELMSFDSQLVDFRDSLLRQALGTPVLTYDMKLN